MRKLIKSLDDASSAGNRRSSPDLDHWSSPDCNWRQKPQEIRPAIVLAAVADECFQDRQRQRDKLDNGRETATRDLPEWCLRNVVTPEGLPSTDRPLVDSEQTRKLVDSARCRSLPHGADQDDHSTEVYLSAEKTHR